LKIVEKMEELDARQEKKPLFKVYEENDENGYGKDDLCLRCSDGRLGTPSRSPSRIHQALFCTQHVELGMHDPCIPGRDGQA